MGAHNILQKMGLDATPYRIPSTTDAETLRVDRQDTVYAVTTAAAETRTLAQPTKPGLRCAVVLDADGGDLTLTVTGGYNQAASTSVTFDDAGDFVIFYSVEVGTSYYWRVMAQEGTGITQTDVTATTLTATALKLAVNAINAAGSTQADAIANAALTAGFNIVGAADNTKGVALPAASAGLVVKVRSSTASKTLPIYPQLTAAIDALGANNAYTLGAATTGGSVTLVAQNSALWWTMPGEVD